MHKKIVAAFFMTCLLVVAAACGNSTSGQSGESEKTEEKTVQIEATNGTVDVPADPKRIVVLDYGVLDTLERLGEKDRVVGIPRQKVPEYLKTFDNDTYTNLGSLKEIDLEKLNSLEPDLIISSGRTTDLNEKFEKIAPTVQLSIDNQKYMESFKNNVMQVAKLVGKEDEAEHELNQIDEKIDNLKANVPSDQKSLTILANEGKASVFGSKSRYGLINDVFGFASVDSTIESSTHGQSVSTEYISEKNPDYLFVIDRSAVVTDKPSAKKVIENELVQKTNAYKKDQIVYLNPEVWYFAGGGLESMNIMIDEVAEAVK
jgi:iron complex transport system substrate-binding protein